MRERSTFVSEAPRANTLLNAKMKVELLVVVEMCTWLSSPRVTGGEDEEGDWNRRPPDI